MRKHASTLTIAYIAKGMADALREHRAGGPRREFNPDDWDGELGLMDEVTGRALLVDAVGDVFNDEGHPGVYVYEVAEEFGREYTHELLDNPRGDRDAMFADTLSSVMLRAQYPASALGAAFHAAGIGLTARERAQRAQDQGRDGKVWLYIVWGEYPEEGTEPDPYAFNTESRARRVHARRA